MIRIKAQLVCNDCKRDGGTHDFTIEWNGRQHVYGFDPKNLPSDWCGDGLEARCAPCEKKHRVALKAQLELAQKMHKKVNNTK